jgi:hypothetical protein
MSTQVGRIHHTILRANDLMSVFITPRDAKGSEIRAPSAADYLIGVSGPIGHLCFSSSVVTVSATATGASCLHTFCKHETKRPSESAVLCQQERYSFHIVAI